MTKSIETIWQQGFIDDKALIAPKINDLYNQKSQNIVDKLKRTFRWNIIAIAIGALAVLVILSAFGMPILALFIASMLLALAWLGKKQLAELEQMDKNTSSYQYIKSFDAWLKGLMQQYTKIYQPNR